MKFVLGLYIKNKEFDYKALYNKIESVFLLKNKRSVSHLQIGNLHISYLNESEVDVSQTFYHENNNGLAILNGRLYIDDKNNVRTFFESCSKNKFKDIDKFEGNLNAIYYQENKEKLFLISDSFGLYPLYYTDNKDYTVFCTEYEALISIFEKEEDIYSNQEAIIQYFELGGVLPGNTFCKDIKTLLPGSIVEINNNKTKTQIWNKLNIKTNNDITITEAAQKLSLLIKDSIDRRINQAPEKYLFDLTAGLDTRLILSCLDANFRKHSSFETLLTPPLNEENDKDVIIAKRLSEKAELLLTIFSFDDWDIEFDEDYFLRWRELYYDKIRIKGLFGGEFMNGDCFRFLPDEVNLLLEKLCLTNSSSCKYKFLRKFTNFNIQNKRTQTLAENDYNPYKELQSIMELYQTQNKKLLFAIWHFSRSFFSAVYGGSRSIWAQPSSFLTKIDTPFLDKNVLNFLLSLPMEYLAGKESHDIYNLIYKTHFPEFNSIPTTSTLGNCDGNAIKYFNDGIEPKNARKPLYEKALNNYISDEQTWNKNIYNKAASLQILKGKENNFTKSFIDFEAYIRYLQKIIRNEP